MTRALRIVKAEPEAISGETVDIYINWKADVRARDWRRVHTEGDRSKPVELPERKARIWR